MAGQTVGLSVMRLAGSPPIDTAARQADTIVRVRSSAFVIQRLCDTRQPQASQCSDVAHTVARDIV
jgi:hypothetical protein